MALPTGSAGVPPSDVGTHCSLSSCNALDLLPIPCTYCAAPFCRHHSSPSAHACSREPSLNIVDPSLVKTPRDGPELRDLLPDAKRSRLSTGAHAPPRGPTDAPLSKQQLALAALKRSIDAKKQPSTATTSATTSPNGTIDKAGGGGGKAASTKEKKVNPTLELMRLTQRAKGADPRKRDGDVPMLDRWYLYVKFVDGSAQTEPETKPVWVQKTVSAGKALDLFADLFRLVNKNHLARTEPAKRLNLALPTAPQDPVNLAHRIDSVVSNGGTILLLRGP
ncbi:hypothetical protein JCM11491_004226 [Sporobolomyces phaffii]